MSKHLTAGDRVRLGERTGTVTIGTLRALQDTGTSPPLEHACRVRWDGDTYSQVIDKRTIKKAHDEEQEVEDAADSGEPSDT